MDSVWNTKKGPTLNKFSHERLINGSCSFPGRARSYRFNHTRSIAEKEKEYTESHKIDELYEFSNDSSRD